MHAHSKRAAHVLGAVAVLVGVTVVLLLPAQRLTAAVGGAFVLLFAIKHVALALTVGPPAAALVARVRGRFGRRSGAEGPVMPPPDGYVRTGEVEPHAGILRIAHDMTATPSPDDRQAFVDAEVGKRVTLLALKDVDTARIRKRLRVHHATTRLEGGAQVEAFLAGLEGTLSAGQTVAIAYDPASKVTSLSVRGVEAGRIEGADFMRATWSLWFGPAAPAAMADGLRGKPHAGMTRHGLHLHRREGAPRS